MLSSTSRFQTTACGISQDSRSYDNMSSNTTSSSFVSDDDLRYFKITLNIKITLDSVTNFPHTLYQLQNGSAAEDDVVDIDQHQTMQGPWAERPNPNPSQVRCYENNSTYSNWQ